MSETFARLMTLVQAAVDLPAEQASAFLVASCQDDDDLLSEARSLFARMSAGSTERFTNALQIDPGSLTETLDAHAVPNYVLHEPLGEGGMGIVFRADQIQPVRREVAIKIVRSGFGQQILDRFALEQQTLASMDHPAIARVYEAGRTVGGLPYFAMEYVRGDSIGRYCTSESKSLEDRLRLFLKVCRGVEHAHMRGVIHRDIKSSNVLAMEVDGQSEVKIIDFGIAKALDAQDGGAEATRIGTIMGTPEYMSPEQAAGTGVDVRTDVYALGVLLYRLCCDNLPFDSETLQKLSPVQLHAFLLNTSPPKPSERLQERPLAALSYARPEKVLGRLRSDLDWIVLRALEKSADDRYQSVADFSEDIERVLRFESPAAAPATVARKISRFYRRNRLLVVSTAAVFFAVSTGAMVSTLAFLQAQRSEQAAQIQADLAAQTSQFLTDMFRSASPFESQGKTLTALDLLNIGAERASELSDQPALQARVYRVIGDSYREIGAFAESRRVLDRAVALAQGQRDDLALAESLHALAELQSLMGQHEAAIENRHSVLALREALLPQDDPEVIWALVRLGSSLSSALRLDEAVAVLNDALNRYDSRSSEDELTLDILGNLAVVLDSAGRYVEAASTGERTVAASLQVLGERHPSTIIRLNNLGLVYTRLYQLDRAEALLARAHDLAVIVLPDDHPRLGYYKQNYASILITKGNFDAAWKLLQESRSINEQRGPDNILLAASAYGLGGWYSSRALHQDAVAAFQSGYDLAVQVEGADSQLAVLNQLHLGRSLIDLGLLEDAERHLGLALSLGDQLRDDQRTFANLSLVRLRSLQGRREEAEALLLDTIARKEKQAAGGAALLSYYSAAVDHFLNFDEADRALGYARKANDSVSALPDNNWIAAMGKSILGRALLASGARIEAMPYLQDAHAVLLSYFPATDPRVVSLAEALM